MTTIKGFTCVVDLERFSCRNRVTSELNKPQEFQVSCVSCTCQTFTRYAANMSRDYPHAESVTEPQYTNNEDDDNEEQGP